MTTLLAAALVAAGAGAPVLVAPGPAAAFDVRAPAAARAAEPFEIEITARDGGGNVVTDYDRTGGGVALSIEEGEVSPARLDPAAFRAGVARTRVTIRRAGRWRIAVRDLSTGARGLSPTVVVEPGPVARFDVRAPAEGRVGEPIVLEVEALDAAGNLVVEYARTGRPVEVRSTGVGTPRPTEIAPEAFHAGRARVPVIHDAAEVVAFVVSAGPAREGERAEGRSGAVRVRAGPLHEFRVTVPPRALAGEWTRIAIEARDAAGNLIEEFDRIGGPVRLGADGRGRLEPPTIDAEAFRDGMAVVHVRYDVAETIRIAATSADGARAGLSGPIVFEGGNVARFDIAAPPEVRAGAPFEIQVWAYDAGGNLVREAHERGIRAKVQGVGGAPVDAAPILAGDFHNGVAIVRAAARRAGPLVIEVLDEATGAVGRSREIRVRPGPAARLDLEAPATARAGEPFDVAIVARDAEGNVVADFDLAGSGVRLRAEGAGRLAPLDVPAGRFVEGRAVVSVTYDLAERVRISAEAEAGGPRGLSGPIDVRAGPAVRFDVEAPAEATAGEVFRLRVVARDRHGNVVTDHDAAGAEAEVFSTVRVAPERIPAAAFQDGVADVEARCDVAGSIRIGVRAPLEGRFIEGLSADIAVRPGPPAALGLALPAVLRAGDEAPVRLEVRDRHGNLVTDLDAAAISLSVRAEGFRIEIGDVPVLPFRAGVTFFEIVPLTTGEGRIVVEEGVTRLAGEAAACVLAGPLDRFDVVLPSAIRAGEPARIGLLALDGRGNVVTDYAGGALLGTDGTGRLAPEVLAPDLFEDGRAEAYILYDRAEAVSIRAAPFPAGTAAPEIAAAALLPSPAGARVVLLATAPIAGETDRSVGEALRVRIAGARLGATVRTRLEGLDPVASVDLAEEGGDVVVAVGRPAGLPHRLTVDRNMLVIEIERGYSRPLPAAPVEPARAEGPSPPPGPPARGGGDIRALLEAGEISGARRLLERRLERDTADAEAAEMLRRIEILERVGVGGAAEGTTRPAPPPPAAGATEDEWERIERMVREARYAEALGALGEYGRRRPEDERVPRLRRRLERLIEVMR